MNFLVEFDSYELSTGSIVTHRFSKAGYATSPSDSPPNAYFIGRLLQPGNYESNVFSNGTTSGEADIAFGLIELANPDGGIDYLQDYAVDGRELRIFSIEEDAVWNSRVALFVGTMEQIEHSWRVTTIRIRDSLFRLKQNIQKTLYLGTTTAGGQNTAEGTPNDIKDKPKPILFGKALNVSPILANQFDRIYQVSDGQFNAGIVVRDAGVPLTFSADYATITALRTASIPGGNFATARNLGLIRVAARPQGDLTVDASEGSDGQRSAAKTVQRLLLRFGLTTSEFSAPDLDALHTLNPAEVGIWTGAESQDALGLVARLLDSIGATCVPDRLGVLRFFRIDVPSGTAITTFGRSRILDTGNGLERLATNDEGRGVPAKKVTINYGFNYTLQTGTALAGATTEAQKSFAGEAYRSVKAESSPTATAYLLAPELEFDTLLVNQNDAQTEANRRLGIYSVRRDRYQLSVKTEFAKNVSLGSIVKIQVNRFGLDSGKLFLVIGINENYSTGTTTLNLFG